MNTFGFDTPFPIRLPFPSLFPHESTVAPNSLRLTSDPSRIEIVFPTNTPAAHLIYNLFLLDHIQSEADAFAWWCKEFDAALARRLIRYNDLLESKATESERHRFRKHIAEFNRQRESDWAYRPTDWKIAELLELGPRGMTVAQVPGGTVVKFSNAFFPIGPSSTNILLMSSLSNITILIPPHPMLKFDAGQIVIGNPDNLPSPTLTSSFTTLQTAPAE